MSDTPDKLRNTATYIKGTLEHQVCLDAAAEIESLRNKLNTDSQAFQIECQKAEIESLRSRLAEAEALLREARVALDDAGSGPEWGEFLSRIDAFLARGKP